MPPILLHVAKSQMPAEILKGMLEQSGIEAHVAPRSDRESMYPNVGWTAGDVNAECEVWIAEDKDLERARAVVEDFEKVRLEPATSLTRRSRTRSWECARRCHRGSARPACSAVE